jgi:hypothetical protein
MVVAVAVVVVMVVVVLDLGATVLECLHVVQVLV